MMTLLGRCHSKDFARLNRGDYIGDHAVISINNALDRQKPGTPLWSKADFVACCLLLRPCANSSIEVLALNKTESTPAQWEERLASFLRSDEGKRNVDDFTVKIHAAVSLPGC